jgi:Zn-dependent M28 family amino/carboxypeptidase
VEDVDLQNELEADVEALAGKIGERNLWRYRELQAAADFIEDSFSRAGLRPQRITYDLDGRACGNIEAEIPALQGAAVSKPPSIILVGAHYDSVVGSPGANDNGSGIAALLALARRFTGRAASAKATAAESTSSTLRFVAFVNEEPPFFQTSQMGSFVYASRCKTRGDQIPAMISLETIGYFSDAPRSQKYPAPGLGTFYPTVGNFIGFVSNTHSRALLRRAMSIFRARSKLPAQGAALPSFIPGVAWSDQWSFWQHGYPGIMITDTAPFRYPHYHAATDTPDKLDYDRFALVVSGMEKVIAELAGSQS